MMFERPTIIGSGFGGQSVVVSGGRNTGEYLGTALAVLALRNIIIKVSCLRKVCTY